MSKRYTVSENDIQHYEPPEVSGRIVGRRDESLRPQTVEEIEAIQKQAYEEARQAGYAEGLKTGLEEMKLKATQLQSIFSFLQHPLNEMDQQVEHQLADLSIVLARQLLKKESSVDAQHIYTLVHESLDYLPIKSRDIRVRLNPEDIALLNQAEINTAEQSWSIIADQSITAGGCVIESDTSHIDASVESRVQQLVDQLSLHQSTDAPVEDSAGNDDATE